MRATLAIQPFRLLFAAQCVSLIGDAVFLVAIAFAVLDVTGSPAALGIVLAIGSLLLVLSMLVSGVWADRLPRLKLMVTSDLVRAAVQATLAALLITDRAELWHLIVLVGIYDVATAFFQPSLTGVIPQLLSTDHLVAGNGLLSTARNVTTIIGMALGGVLVAAVAPGGALAIDAASFLVSAALLLAIGPVAAASNSDERQSFRIELAEGWHEVRSHRWLWIVLLNACFHLMLFEAPLQVVGPLVTREHYGGALAWGLFGAAVAVGATIGSLVAASGRLRRPMLVTLWVFFSICLVPLLLAMRAPLPALLASAALAGSSFGLFDTIWHAELQRRIPVDRLARVSAWDWMCSAAGMPIGFALAGILAAAIGTTPLLIGMAISAGVLTIVLLMEPEVRSIGSRASPVSHWRP